MNKSITPALIIGLIALVVGFYGGMKYNQKQISNNNDSFGASRVGMMALGRGGARAGGSFANGTILSKDATSLTLQLRAGGSQIVFLTTNTPVLKTASGSLADLIVGENVNITGSANSDGSLTASSIQIRPAGGPNRSN